MLEHKKDGAMGLQIKFAKLILNTKICCGNDDDDDGSSYDPTALY